MPNRILRPLLIAEFLLAIQAVFTLWSEVGGQYHLDLMFWPWKLGVVLLSAGLIVAITAALARTPDEARSVPARVWVLTAALVLTMAIAGVVTYYYHVNEPSDDEEDTTQQQPASFTRMNSPDPTGVLAPNHRLTGFAAERGLKFGHI